MRAAVTALPPYHFSRHLEPIKLDQNEAPDDLGEDLRTTVMERLRAASYNRYPDLHPVTLERAIADLHGWPHDGVVVANGSNVLIQALVVLSGLGRQVLTVTPTFAVYAAQARVMGAALAEVPLAGGFALPVEDLLLSMAAGHGALFLTDPAAPTGNGHDPGDVARLLRAADAHGGWLGVIDEAYSEFAEGDHTDLVRGLPSAVSLRTLSKALGLAGVRLGYALADPAVATQLRKVLLPFSVSTLQVAVGLTVLERRDVVDARVARARSERARLREALARLPGVEVFPSVTNFVLFRVADPAGVHRSLLDAGIVIRRQDHLPGADGCLRVSVGTSSENDAFLAAVSAAVGAAEGVQR